jgi:hypothetical protein
MKLIHQIQIPTTRAFFQPKRTEAELRHLFL